MGKKTAPGVEMQGVSKKSCHFVSQTDICQEPTMGMGFFEKVNIKRCVEQKDLLQFAPRGQKSIQPPAAAFNFLKFHLFF